MEHPLVVLTNELQIEILIFFGMMFGEHCLGRKAVADLSLFENSNCKDNSLTGSRLLFYRGNPNENSKSFLLSQIEKKEILHQAITELG